MQPGFLQSNVSLAPLTTWRIGGPAEWFAQPTGRGELVEAVNWAREHSMAITVLGRGSNVLIADAGVSGFVLCLRNLLEDPVEHVGNALMVPAGMSLPRLSKEVADRGFSGYEFYCGIPGTVGGAVVMNAGFGPCDERQTANRCDAVEVMAPCGAIAWHSYAEFSPTYRHTRFLEHPELIVLSARFLLMHRAERATIRKETAAHVAMRKARQPLTRPTAGSVFAAANGVPAAVYIDRCGLKGFQVGGAIVSPKHANWIENTGHATASDVLALINLIQSRVWEQAGVALHPEVRVMGFGNASG